MYRLMQREGRRVAAFGDNDETRWGTAIDGVPVWSLKQVAGADPEMVCIAIMNRETAESVRKDLLAAGFAGPVSYTHLDVYKRQPAEWAGEEELYASHLEQMQKEWWELGEPTVILACPNCAKLFKQYLPEIPTVFLTEVMEEWGIPESVSAESGVSYGIFDPCASREFPNLQENVRRVAAQAGISFERDVYKRQRTLWARSAVLPITATTRRSRCPREPYTRLSCSRRWLTMQRSPRYIPRKQRRCRAL